MYYNYRHYNPQEGRWISLEPLQESGNVNLCQTSGNSNQFIDVLGNVIIYVGGNGEKGKKEEGGDRTLFERAQDLTSADYTIAWDEYAEDHTDEKGRPAKSIYNLVYEILGKNPNEPIVIIGFSYGGDSAYKAAKKLKADCKATQDKKNSKIYLVTIEPVSQFNGDIILGEKHPGVDEWINVAREANAVDCINAVPGTNLVTGTATALIAGVVWLGGVARIPGAYDMAGTLIAGAGGAWNSCPAANVNVTLSGKHHGDINVFLNTNLPERNNVLLNKYIEFLNNGNKGKEMSRKIYDKKKR